MTKLLPRRDVQTAMPAMRRAGFGRVAAAQAAPRATTRSPANHSLESSESDAQRKGQSRVMGYLVFGVGFLRALVVVFLRGFFVPLFWLVSIYFSVKFGVDDVCAQDTLLGANLTCASIGEEAQKQGATDVLWLGSCTALEDIRDLLEESGYLERTSFLDLIVRNNIRDMSIPEALARTTKCYDWGSKTIFYCWNAIILLTAFLFPRLLGVYLHATKEAKFRRPIQELATRLVWDSYFTKGGRKRGEILNPEPRSWKSLRKSLLTFQKETGQEAPTLHTEKWYYLRDILQPSRSYAVGTQKLASRSLAKLVDLIEASEEEVEKKDGANDEVADSAIERDFELEISMARDRVDEAERDTKDSYDKLKSAFTKYRDAREGPHPAHKRTNAQTKEAMDDACRWFRINKTRLQEAQKSLEDLYEERRQYGVNQESEIDKRKRPSVIMQAVIQAVESEERTWTFKQWLRGVWSILWNGHDFASKNHTPSAVAPQPEEESSNISSAEVRHKGEEDGTSKQKTWEEQATEYAKQVVARWEKLAFIGLVFSWIALFVYIVTLIAWPGANDIMATLEKSVSNSIAASPDCARLSDIVANRIVAFGGECVETETIRSFLEVLETTVSIEKQIADLDSVLYSFVKDGGKQNFLLRFMEQTKYCAPPSRSGKFFANTNIMRAVLLPSIALPTFTYFVYVPTKHRHFIPKWFKDFVYITYHTIRQTIILTMKWTKGMIESLLGATIRCLIATMAGIGRAIICFWKRLRALCTRSRSDSVDRIQPPLEREPMLQRGPQHISSLEEQWVPENYKWPAFVALLVACGGSTIGIVVWKFAFSEIGPSVPPAPPTMATLTPAPTQLPTRAPTPNPTFSPTNAPTASTTPAPTTPAPTTPAPTEAGLDDYQIATIAAGVVVFLILLGARRHILRFLVRFAKVASSAAATGAYHIASFLRGFGNGIMLVLSILFDIISHALKSLGQGVIWAWRNFVGAVSKWWQHIVKIVAMTWNTFVGVVKGLWFGIVRLGTWAWNTFTSVVSRTWKFIVRVVERIWTTFTYVVARVWLSFVSGVAFVWEGFVHVIIRVWGTIVGAVACVWLTIVRVVSGTWKTFTGGVEMLWNALCFVVEAIWKGIVAVIVGIWKVFTGSIVLLCTAFVKGVVLLWTPIDRFFGITAWIPASILSFLTDVARVIQRAWEALVKTITSVWKTFTQSVATVRDTVVRIVSKSWKGVVFFVSSAWNTLVDGVKMVWRNIYNFVAFSWFGLVFIISSAWGHLVSRVVFIWNGLVKLVKATWNAMVWAIKSTWFFLVNMVTTAWDLLVSVVTKTWFSLVFVVTKTWQALVKTVTVAWKTFVQVVTGTAQAIKWIWTTCVAAIVGAWKTLVQVVTLTWTVTTSAATLIAKNTLWAGTTCALGVARTWKRIKKLASWTRKRLVQGAWWLWKLAKTVGTLLVKALIYTAIGIPLAILVCALAVAFVALAVAVLSVAGASAIAIGIPLGVIFFIAMGVQRLVQKLAQGLRALHNAVVPHLPFRCELCALEFHRYRRWYRCPDHYCRAHRFRVDANISQCPGCNDQLLCNCTSTTRPLLEKCDKCYCTEHKLKRDVLVRGGFCGKSRMECRICNDPCPNHKMLYRTECTECFCVRHNLPRTEIRDGGKGCTQCFCENHPDIKLNNKDQCPECHCRHELSRADCSICWCAIHNARKHVWCSTCRDLHADDEANWNVSCVRTDNTRCLCCTDGCDICREDSEVAEEDVPWREECSHHWCALHRRSELESEGRNASEKCSVCRDPCQICQANKISSPELPARTACEEHWCEIHRRQECVICSGIEQACPYPHDKNMDKVLTRSECAEEGRHWCRNVSHRDTFEPGRDTNDLEGQDLNFVDCEGFVDLTENSTWCPVCNDPCGECADGYKRARTTCEKHFCVDKHCIPKTRREDVDDWVCEPCEDPCLTCEDEGLTPPLRTACERHYCKMHKRDVNEGRLESESRDDGECLVCTDPCSCHEGKALPECRKCFCTKHQKSLCMNRGTCAEGFCSECTCFFCKNDISPERNPKISAERCQTCEYYCKHVRDRTSCDICWCSVHHQLRVIENERENTIDGHPWPCAECCRHAKEPTRCSICWCSLHNTLRNFKGSREDYIDGHPWPCDKCCKHAEEPTKCLICWCFEHDKARNIGDSLEDYIDGHYWPCPTCKPCEHRVWTREECEICYCKAHKEYKIAMYPTEAVPDPGEDDDGDNGDLFAMLSTSQERFCSKCGTIPGPLTKKRFCKFAAKLHNCMHIDDPDEFISWKQLWTHLTADLWNEATSHFTEGGRTERRLHERFSAVIRYAQNTIEHFVENAASDLQIHRMWLFYDRRRPNTAGRDESSSNGETHLCRADVLELFDEAEDNWTKDSEDIVFHDPAADILCRSDLDEMAHLGKKKPRAPKFDYRKVFSGEKFEQQLEREGVLEEFRGLNPTGYSRRAEDKIEDEKENEQLYQMLMERRKAERDFFTSS